MPARRKAPGTHVDTRNERKTSRQLKAVAETSVERFDPPEGLCKDARNAWEAFWEDRQADLLTKSGKVVLLRWIDSLNRYLVSTRAADREPIVYGSKDQPRPNPLYKVAEQARAVMNECERQLGIGGLNAASLGLAAVAEKRSLQELNKRYGSDDDTSEADEEDPRLTVIQGSVES